MNGSDSLGKLILRLTIGVLVLLHGIPKLMNPASLDGIGKMLAPYGLPMEAAFAVYLGEIVAPVLIIIGLLTRLGGLIIAVNMAVAIFLVHMGSLMVFNQFGGWAIELEAVYLLGGLAILFMGSGKFAVRRD
ncbi:MAG: putative oxidoreductase [Parasphingorhabdus sp.]|jgi:putative oxidoreductase